MTSQPTHVVLPAEFIAARVLLLPVELARGYRLGHVSDRSVVRLAEQLLATGFPVSPHTEELALLLSADYDRVPDLVAEIDEAEPSAPSNHTEVWLYLVLAWIYEHREEFADPLAEIETVYADFGYPEQIEGLVRYLPAPPGQSSGPGAVEARWKDFLDRQGTHYARRADHG
jgi:hypothetical protein